MPARPWKVFLSYSSKQADHARRLRATVKPLESEGRITVFQDSVSIRAGAGWEDVLRSALEEMDLLLCLLSIDWRASDWCQEEYAHAARRGVRIVPVLTEPCPWTGWDVSRWQLAGPREAIGSLRHPDEGWTRVHEDLRHFLEEEQASPLPALDSSGGPWPDAGESLRSRRQAPPGERLLVELRDGRVRYRLGNELAPRLTLPWTDPPRGTGRALGEALFLPPEVRRNVLARGADHEVGAGAVSLRLRIDPGPRGNDLPWELLAVGESVLVERGWTIERGPVVDAVPAVSLGSPFDLVLLSPRCAPDPHREAVEAAARSLLRRLMGPVEGDRHLRVVRTGPDLQSALQPDRDLVFWARTRSSEGEIAVDNAKDGCAWFALSALDRLLVERHRLVLLELPEPTSWLPSRPPAVITWPADIAGPARLHSALDLLEALALGKDPVTAATDLRHKSAGHALLRAHARFGSWTTERAVPSEHAGRIRRRLDRSAAKAGALDAVTDLLKDRDRRVLTLVGVGDCSQPMADLAAQIVHHLDEHLEGRCQVLVDAVRMPEAPSDDSLRAALLRVLGDEADLAAGMSARIARGRGHTKIPQVLLLDWRVVGAGADSPFNKDKMRAWLGFAHRVLAPLEMGSDRLVLLLSFRLGNVQDVEASLKGVAALAVDPGEVRAAHSKRVHSLCLPPVGSVTETDIKRILDDPACSSCPREWTPSVARAIYDAYHGAFDPTVESLEQALRFASTYRSWFDRAPPVPPALPQEEF